MVEWVVMHYLEGNAEFEEFSEARHAVAFIQENLDREDMSGWRLLRVHPIKIEAWL